MSLEELLSAPMVPRWRVLSFSKTKKEATCTAYFINRDARQRLDDVVKPENWKIIENKIFCKIGIKIGDEWVWKVSKPEKKDSPEVINAFKRACFQWGIGCDIYELSVERVPTNEIKNATNSPYPVNEKTGRLWRLDTYINKKIENRKTADWLETAKQWAGRFARIGDGNGYRVGLKMFGANIAKEITGTEERYAIVRRWQEMFKKIKENTCLK